MATTRFLPLDKLAAWLDTLAKDQVVYTPQREGTAVVYRTYQPGVTPELNARPTESAKHVIFPRAHELFSFSYKGDPEVVGKKDITLTEPEEPKETVVFGAPSCDARGFFTFDPVYDGCGTKGIAKDVYFLKRRERTAFIVLACQHALSTCFCNWTGGSPTSCEGADVRVTKLADGYALEACTPKGEALVAQANAAEATQEQESQMNERHEKAEASVNPLPGAKLAPQEIAAAVRSHFDNKDFWKNESSPCLSCGACTYLCPTCYCFNITDESNGISGVRLRSWDACMTSLFTLEASGHNPRTGKADRMRNRIGHKLSYYPTLHGRLACCGCGRCIKSCPSSIDIRRIMQHALAAVKESAHG